MTDPVPPIIRPAVNQPSVSSREEPSRRATAPEEELPSGSILHESIELESSTPGDDASVGDSVSASSLNLAALPRPRLRSRFDAAQTWTTTVVAVVALALSSVNLIQANTAPNVTVALPNEIRIAQGGNPSLQIYLQPSLVIDRKSDRTALIKTFRLGMHRTDGGVPDPNIYWNEFGQFNWISQSEGFNYQYAGDPAPVVITQDKPQLPLLTLDADNYLLAPGTWNGKLTIYRADGTEIDRSFCLILTPLDTDWLRQRAGNQWRAFRNDLSPDGSPDACYTAGPVPA